MGEARKVGEMQRRLDFYKRGATIVAAVYRSEATRRKGEKLGLLLPGILALLGTGGNQYG